MDSISLAVCQVDPAKIAPGTIPEAEGQEGFVALVTWLPRDQVMRIGLPRGAICGVLRDGTQGIVPDNFVPNRDFIEILDYLNANHLDPSLIEFIQHADEPRIAVIDQRSPDVNADIPSEDILGVYQLEGGRIAQYEPNPHYRLVSARGTFALTPWLRHCLVSAVLLKQ